MVLKERFLQNPNILSVSGAYTVPGVHNTAKKGISRVGAPPEEMTMFQSLAVDYDYVQTMRLELVAGRNFSVSYPTDANDAVLLNQTAVKHLQLAQPIGEELMLPGKDGMRKVRVIGVIRDFHLYSFKEKIEPILLYINPEHYYLVAVKLRAQDFPTTLTKLEEVWKNVLPDAPFKYTYLEDTYNSLYVAEEKIRRLLVIFAGLAVFVACLGLFGLVSFMTERRSKEIGIRKALGASVNRIVTLLLSDFTKWVLLANLIAWPIAWYAMNRWLENFAFRINIGWPRE
ncbi:MAG: ABC transporter permease, partial [bacterium]